MKLIEHFVGGKIIPGSSDKKGKVYNPATGEQESEVRLATKSDLDQAVEVAKKAFETWSLKPSLQRARIMFKFKELIEKNSDELTRLIVSEHGKVYEDAQGSLTRGLEVVEFACGIPHLLKGEFSENVGTNIDSWSTRQPLGVCAGITPFNFPAMVPMWMFPISIACGNSFVLKPSEKNPSCAIKLAELFTEAGLPDGIFNVLNGDKDVVNMLLKDERVSSISFVGSTPVAKYIYSESAKYNKRVQALGGAKNHLVVMPDANINQAVDGIMGAAYGSAGERCMAISVAVAVGDIADELVEKINIETQKLKIAPWTDIDSDMGPVISAEHKEKIENYIQSGINEGAELVADGRNYKIQGYENGYFVGPTLFDKVKSNMQIYKEEIFGPVLSVVRAKDFSEAMDLVNSHQFGNGTSIYTSDGDTARNFSSNCKIGMVGINIPIPVPMAFHSFGGWKRSLFGDQHMHGPEGVRFYTKLKTITSRWPSGPRSDPEFVMPTMK